MSLTALALTLMASCVPHASPPHPGDGAPPELGRVAWLRDVDAGFARAREQGQPLLILFQEVPGCSTCVSFGQEPLSQPLLVEAIETLFVPVCIYTSAGGSDDEQRRRYDEPAFNFPVCRFFAPDGRELLPRRDRIWTTGGLASRLVAALSAAGRPVPEWLSLVEQELATERQQTATFAMFCFWEGEAQLGALDGVVGTRPGFVEGQEVVEVTFEPARISYADLLQAATARKCASTVFTSGEAQLATARAVVGDKARALPAPARDAGATDRWKRLAAAPRALALLPLTALQATRINAALSRGAEPTPWLSPRQLELQARLEAALEQDAEALEGLQASRSLQAMAAGEAALRSRLDARSARAGARRGARP